jgi:hypothetical protein
MWLLQEQTFLRNVESYKSHTTSHPKQWHSSSTLNDNSDVDPVLHLRQLDELITLKGMPAACRMAVAYRSLAGTLKSPVGRDCKPANLQLPVISKGQTQGGSRLNKLLLSAVYIREVIVGFQTCRCLDIS